MFLGHSEVNHVEFAKLLSECFQEPQCSTLGRSMKSHLSMIARTRISTTMQAYGVISSNIVFFGYWAKKKSGLQELPS